MPRECWRENIVFDTLNTIVDKDFAKNNGKVKYTTSIPAYTGWSDELFSDIHLELYNKAGSDYGSAKLTGYKTGDKFDVFTKQLILDNAFSGGAFFIVFCILWLHTSSGFIATFGFLQILLNLGVGYGIYMGVMFLPFFPFLNLVGIFVVVGIGADDIFVFMDCWKQTVKEVREMLVVPVKNSKPQHTQTNITNTSFSYSSERTPRTRNASASSFIGPAAVC